MSFGDTLGKAWEDAHLFAALLELTYRCNLDCFFCYNDLALDGEPLRLPDYETLLDELRELGCLQLTLSGGEPLSHPDFFAIGRLARDRGFVVRIKSNGHALGRDAAERLVDEVAPYMVEVSLHGATPETHERQTRVRGSFSRLLDNLAGLRELGLRVKLNCPLTRWNEGEIEAMYRIADELALSLHVDPEVTPRDNGDVAPLEIAATRDGLKRLFAVQAARARNGSTFAPVERQGDAIGAPAPVSKHCGAGSSGIAVDPYANVYPCVSWRRPVGNLHESSLREIWETSAELTRVRGITTDAKAVVTAQGKLGPLLGFCPGAAEMVTGDPLRVPDGAKRRAETLSGLVTISE